MTTEFRPIRPDDIERCVEFGLEAFRPIFKGWQQDYGKPLLDALRPNWEQAQTDYIRDACSSDEKETWLATMDNAPVGLVVMSVDAETGLGYIELLAVDPKYHGQGIGTALNELAVRQLREMGVAFIVVATGTDEGQAAARRSYEKVGFDPMPVHPYHYVLRVEEM